MQHQALRDSTGKEKMWLLVLVLVAGAARLIPEIIAYPIPIGYDVINYYIPVLTNFYIHWDIVSTQFPLYVLILYSVTSVTMLAPKIIVPTAAILFYILFSVSVFYLARRVFQLDCSGSFFLSLFVIFQSSLLRTTWDLHKDMLSLTAMFFAISLGLTSKYVSKGIFVLVLSLCIVSALTDRMVGLLSVGTLLVYKIIKRRKIEGILATVTSFFRSTKYQWLSPNKSDHPICRCKWYTSSIWDIRFYERPQQDFEDSSTVVSDRIIFLGDLSWLFWPRTRSAGNYF